MKGKFIYRPENKCMLCAIDHIQIFNYTVLKCNFFSFTKLTLFFLKK